MKSLKDIEKLIKEFKIKPAPEMRSRVLDKALEIQKHCKKQNISGSYTWRIIMHKPTTKLATVAATILIAVLAITFLDKAVTPAWAIEDTIKALKMVYSIKMSGPVSSTSEFGEKNEGDFIIWAKPDADGTESEELRFEMSNQIVVVDASGKTYFYNPEQNSVLIKDFKNFRISPWLGSEFFHIVKKFAENWKVSYGKDEETSRDSIFATCIYTPESKSWWFQFDSETRLPVRFRQWTNLSFQGEPEFYAEKIEYNPQLPDGTFEFKIPEGAKVAKLQQKLPEYLDDTNCGILVEGLSDEEACLMIVEDYLRALIDGDWEYLAQLRPICNAENWELKFKRNESWPIEVLEISQPVCEDGCGLGPVVSCMVKYSDGQIKNIHLVVKFREIDGNSSCVIAGTYGGIKDFER
jgi:outer membrane lipoprotein-sorting protein